MSNQNMINYNDYVIVLSLNDNNDNNIVIYSSEVNTNININYKIISIIKLTSNIKGRIDTIKSLLYITLKNSDSHIKDNIHNHKCINNIIHCLKDCKIIYNVYNNKQIKKVLEEIPCHKFLNIMKSTKYRENFILMIFYFHFSN